MAFIPVSPEQMSKAPSTFEINNFPSPFSLVHAAFAMADFSLLTLESSTTMTIICKLPIKILRTNLKTEPKSVSD